MTISSLELVAVVAGLVIVSGCNLVARTAGAVDGCGVLSAWRSREGGGECEPSEKSKVRVCLTDDRIGKRGGIRGCRDVWDVGRVTSKYVIIMM